MNLNIVKPVCVLEHVSRWVQVDGSAHFGVLAGANGWVVDMDGAGK